MHIPFKNFLLVIGTLMSFNVFAQQNNLGSSGILPPPLPLREVSGIVKDNTDKAISGVTITLTSTNDTLKTTTNEDGIFILKNVRQATFVITVSSIGYLTSTRKYLNNDIAKKIVLDPIILGTKTTELAEVKVNGTPSIVYKTDTVEYKASDYKVRENATLDELLKKMEGMEVGPDGTLVHQGQQVTRAKLNGKDYAGGSVAQAIKNLPAEIIEKVQIVDDYGDQAGRTGIKDGDPTKVLNVTTKKNRSVGNILRLTAGAGNDGRYDEHLFAQRIDGNKLIGLLGNLTNTINGVATNNNVSVGNTSVFSNLNPDGSGGTTRSGGPSFNYRDQWNKYLQVNGNYIYKFNNIHSINVSRGETTSSLGSTSVINNSTGNNNNITQNASFELEYAPDNSNFLRITPNFNYSGGNIISNAQKTFKGLQNQYSNGVSTGKNSNSNYGAIVFYQYIFKKPKRNISIQFNLLNADQQQKTEQKTNIQYRDANQNSITDSLIHRAVGRSNTTENYRASLTYVEPLNPTSQLEFHAQSEYRGYNNTTVTDSIDATGNHMHLAYLSNVYKYSFTNSRIALNYRLNRSKYNVSLGVIAIPAHLEGTNVSGNITTNRNDFYVVPIFRLQYSFSRLQQISINYSGAPTEPSFIQIQPIPDVSDPQNVVFGNPDLKPSFKHSVNMVYNNYMPNQKLNLSANVNTSFYDNEIVNNYVQVEHDLLKNGQVIKNYLYQTYFVNVTGARSIIGNYNIAKQMDDMKYSFALNGTVSYNYNLAMSNGFQNHVTSWDFNERLGPQITSNESIEINPYVSYEISRSFNSLPNAFISNYTKMALNLEGKVYLFKNKTGAFEYDLSKNYIHGISSNITKNPFVANAYFQMELSRRRICTFKVSAYDLFNQNNFINRVITPNGFTDTKSNTLSRYVMISFILNLQKWSGVVKRNGKELERRGDGSFIY